jgi:hypothetical protein
MLGTIAIVVIIIIAIMFLMILLILRIGVAFLQMRSRGQHDQCCRREHTHHELFESLRHGVSFLSRKALSAMKKWTDLVTDLRSS